MKKNKEHDKKQTKKQYKKQDKKQTGKQIRMQAKKQNRVVLVFGTFDLLHKGHIDFFRQARKYGNYLVAVVARDKTVFSVKKRNTVQNQKIRLANVKKHCDSAVLGSLGNKYAVIKKIRPDAICLGYDQNSFTKNLKKELKKMNLAPGIVRLKPFKKKIYKSSIIRKIRKTA